MEETLSVSEFKAKCLDLFKRLSDHSLAKVTVTRRGKPVAVVTAPVSVKSDSRALHGFMAGSVHIPEGMDLTAPIFEGEWEAEVGRLPE